MDEQDIFREICVNLPLVCPRCQTAFRYDRIDVKGDWEFLALCENCDLGFSVKINPKGRDIVKAKEAVCGDRSIAEEVRLRASGDIPANYELQLAGLLGTLWEAGPKDDPYPPPALV